ncbi:MAG: phosphoglycerate dehydrogenase related dehydrogenase [halophilic archaeon J07HX5]|nr:MAG: phosphoglycerate dehydrogenase related dehydrogenase [halophilic archaeon J07HX5]
MWTGSRPSNLHKPVVTTSERLWRSLIRGHELGVCSQADGRVSDRSVTALLSTTLCFTDTVEALVTANFSPSGIDRLESLGFDVEFDPIESRAGRLPVGVLKARLSGVDVFISGFEGVPAELMDAATHLRLIVCPRGGPAASVDISAATDRSIPVLYAPGRNAETVADHTMGLLLAATRNIARAHHRLRMGKDTGDPRADAAAGGERADVTWGIGSESPYTTLRGPELGGRTLGIVGFSQISRRVAKRATMGSAWTSSLTTRLSTTSRWSRSAPRKRPLSGSSVPGATWSVSTPR